MNTPTNEVKKPTNPPAFPVNVEARSYGLTLRDYFAAKALAGYMAIIDGRTYKPNSEQTAEAWRDEIAANDAKHIYRIADAMLAEREK